MPKRKTQNEILTEFREAHGKFYDYSKVKYINSSTNVTVICPVHGEFTIAPGHHKKGVGCRKCYFDSQKISKSNFVLRSQQHFGTRYDYSLFDFLPTGREKVQIKCLEHDVIFWQEPKNHMRGHTGCPKCRSLKLSGNREDRGTIKSQEQLNQDFKGRAQKVHGNKYNYSDFVYVNNTTEGKICCQIHGDFWQIPGNHIRGSQCPKCAVEEQKEGTFKKECEEKGVDYHRALKRRQAGLSEAKIFDEGFIRSIRAINEVTVFGETYPNLEEAIRILNPSASAKTISRWISDGMASEEAFERIPNPGYAEGIIYLITHKLSGKQYVGLTIQTMERRWQEGHIIQAVAGSIKSEESLHAAIREYGSEAFDFKIIDKGTTKKDLEIKERKWIKKLNTLVPNGYNISTGGVSGGSNKKPTTIDGYCFESVKKAAEHLAESRNISLSAAKKRISTGTIDAKKPAKPGESLVKTKAYKSWSRIIHGVLNPKSKDYIEGVDLCDDWCDFHNFLSDVGNPPEKQMALTRIDKTKGFFPENCAWLTKSEASKINAEYMKKTGRLTGRKKKS